MNFIENIKKSCFTFCSSAKNKLRFELMPRIKKSKRFPFLLALVFLAVVFVLGYCFLPGPSQKAKTAAFEVVNLADNVRAFYRSKPNFWGLNTEFAVKNHIFPQDMIVQNKARNALGRPVLLGIGEKGDTVFPGSMGFDVVYSELGRTHCIFLLSFPYSAEQTLGLSSITLINENQSDVLFTWGGALPLPPSAEAAKKYCAKDNSIIWHFE